MAVLSVGNVLEVKSFCYAGDQAGINVRHWLVQTVIGNPTDVFVAAEYELGVNTLYKDLMPSAAAFQGVSAQIINVLPKPVRQESFAHAGPGTFDSSPLMPGQVSGILTLRTGLAGRANRGRVYVAFPSTGAAMGDPSIPNGSYITALGFLLTYLTSPQTYTDGVNTVTIIPVVHHRATGLVTPIVTGNWTVAWATQRRRGDFGRTNPPFPS